MMASLHSKYTTSGCQSGGQITMAVSGKELITYKLGLSRQIVSQICDEWYTLYRLNLNAG